MLFLTVFIDLLGFGIVLPLLPIYADQFTVDSSGWVIAVLMSSFSAMQFLFAPVWGRLSDRIGRRPVLMIGLASSFIFYGLFGVASVVQNLGLLFVSRIGAGIAGATIPTAQAYIADSTSLAERPRGMALIGAAFGLGFTFGPLLGMLALVPGDALGSWPGIWGNSAAAGPATARSASLGPGPGIAASVLSLIALVVAYFKLPESLRPNHAQGEHHLLDLRALRGALATPSIGLLLAASFLCVFSFGNFESTVSLLMKGRDRAGTILGPFQFDVSHLFLAFAYIGLVLSVVQGGLVRRLAGRISEGALGVTGAAIEIAGFLLLVLAVRQASAGLLFTAMTAVVGGFAFMTPALNSLISRRSHPAQQGGVLGVSQSMGALARICGPLAGLPLLHRDETWPFWLASVLMAVGGAMVWAAAKGGQDYAAPHRPSPAGAGEQP